MSLAFSDTTTKRGLVQLYEKEIGANYGDISGNTNALYGFVADCNIAFDEFLSIAFPASGVWQYDDTNFTDYPILKTNLVSGQRDYTFTSDGDGNLILDLYRVAILSSATATTYKTIYPIDVQSNNEDSGILTESTTTGTPDRYDKTANGLFLDPIPSYSVSNGLKIYINREPSYFTSTDDTKKPGVPGIFHEWFVIVPALKYAGRKSTSNYNQLFIRVEKMKEKIEEYFNRRSKDESFIINGEPINYE